MAVTFDVVQPSSAGTSSSGATTLSWTHTVGGGVTSGAVLVFADIDANSTSGWTAAATCATLGMTSLGRVTTTSGAEGGFIQGWYITGVSTGANAIVVTASGGTPAHIIGGSLSFSGVSGVGTPVTKNTDSSPNITFATNTSGNIIAAGFASGSSVSGVSGVATSRFIDNVSSANATGSMGCSTAPGTGSSVTLTWTGGGSSCCLVGVEVQAAGTDSGPNYPGAASDLGGGAGGSWVNPGNAEALDAAYATWTA